MNDTINRQDAIRLAEQGQIQGFAWQFKKLCELPSVEPERLTDDDFETIRIHLNAYKEKLCNQQRWEEAEEYQRIIDRFMAFASAEPEINKQKLIRTMNTGIIATNTEDVYSCGMRNGIRWCRALLEDDPPKFEDASQYAEPKPNTGKWIPYSKVYECRYECSLCGYHLIGIHESEANFCPNCGAYMKGE